MPKKNEAPIVEAAEEQKNTGEEMLILTEEQGERHALFIQMCRDAKEQRDQSYEEFDDMTYDADYYSNKKAAAAYLRPKVNDDEVRIVTPTTESRLQVLNNELLSMNLEAEALAYDSADNELKNLGKDMMDVVTRTNDMEKDDDFWEGYLYELLTQRAAFYEEVDEYQIYNKRKALPMSPEGIDVTKIGKSKEMVVHRARKRLLVGLRVYLGDIRIPARDFQTDQPYICIYTQRTYTATRQIYKNWSRWKHVKPGKCDDKLKPNYYRMNEVKDNIVEEIRIIDPVNNEYYVILNGVPMMEESTPLWYDVLPGRRYTVSMVAIKGGNDFAYGKPPVASAKTLQALDEEIIRNLVLKFRQALEPAMGVSAESGSIISRDVFAAGAITQGIEKDEVFPINPGNQGVTQSEYNMFQLIEQKTQEFIGAGTLGGNSESGEQTATEIQQNQVNSIKNLGHVVAAFMRAKRDAPYLRIYNILENFVKPVKKYINPINNEVSSLYEKFTLNNAMLNNGKRGKKIIQFTERNMTPMEKQGIFEFEKHEEANGRPVKFRTINIKELAKINVFWHIVVNQQRREGSALNRILFRDALDQAVGLSEITGRQIDGNKAINEFEQSWQYRNFFLDENAQPARQREGAEELSGQIQDLKTRTSMGSQLTEGARGQTQRPSLNEAMRQ